MSPVGMAVLSSIAFILALGWIYRRMSVAGTRDQVSEQWWREFTPERYAPLSRLLGEEDFVFVRQLPGYRRGMDRRLRSRRIAVFSSFLLDMRRDFERLQSVGQALLVTGQHSPGLHEDLFRLRVQFLRSWWLVRAELALYSLGIGAVDTSRLVATFRGTARLFVPEMTPQASAA